MNSNVCFPHAKWVWWDLDDTLWDFQANSLLSLAEVYIDFGLGRLFSSIGEWCDAYHEINHQLWEQYNRGEIDMAKLRMERFRRPFVNAGMDDASARELSAEMDVAYLRSLGEKPGLVAGARDVLDYLRERGYRMGILSNGFSDVQYNKLATSGITGYFDHVVLSDAVGFNKPDTRIFDYAARLAGASSKECVMIGDNPSTDILGAGNAGWNTILFDPAGKYPDSNARIMKLDEIRGLL